MTPDGLSSLAVILWLISLVFGVAALVFRAAGRRARRRPAGSREDVAVFVAALDHLEEESIAEYTAVEAEADRRGLTGKARRCFYAQTVESPGWLAANQAVIAASERISSWQEFLVRNGFLKIKNQETGR